MIYLLESCLSRFQAPFVWCIMMYDIDDDDDNVQNLVEKRVTTSRVEQSRAESGSGGRKRSEIRKRDRQVMYICWVNRVGGAFPSLKLIEAWIWFYFWFLIRFRLPLLLLAMIWDATTCLQSAQNCRRCSIHWRGVYVWAAHAYVCVCALPHTYNTKYWLFLVDYEMTVETTTTAMTTTKRGVYCD